MLTVVEGAWAKAAPSGGGALIVHMDDVTGALDKTWQEIADAAPLVYIDYEGMYYPLTNCGTFDGTYYLNFHNYWDSSSPELALMTDAPDGYPHQSGIAE